MTLLDSAYKYTKCGRRVADQVRWGNLAADAPTCFARCKVQNAYALLRPNAQAWRTEGWICGCLNTDPRLDTTTTTDTCPSDGYYVFERIDSPARLAARTAPASAGSEAARKRRQVARAAEEASKYQLCPGALRACRIPGQYGYECVDTTQDLESCGGCPHGDYGTGEITGKDCTAIEHVGRRGSVSCQAGTCSVQKCEPGFVPSADGSHCGPNANKFRRG